MFEPLLNKKMIYNKPIRVGNIWNNSYIKYESNSDRNKNLSVKKYLNEIEPYLRDIIFDL